MLTSIGKLSVRTPSHYQVVLEFFQLFLVTCTLVKKSNESLSDENDGNTMLVSSDVNTKLVSLDF